MSQILKLTHENQQLKRQISQYQQVLGVSPFVDDSLFKGGYRVVKTIVDRDNIDCCHSKQGMIVCVIGENLSFKEYRLISDCKNKQWEEIQTQVTENDVTLVEDYSELSETLTTQKELNLVLKQLILDLQTQIDNVELTDEKVQITENTDFAQTGQTQKDFNKKVSDYKTNSDLKNQEQDDRLSDIEGKNIAQDDLINDLQSALDGKLDKGTYTGNAQDLKNSIDSKLDKPTTTSNTTSYPFVVGEDGNGNSARLPAGDLGKNFFNSDLSNTTARSHTMNAGITVNTLGNPHTLSGLPNKNADITNFRKVRVQNTSGLDSVVDSKNLTLDAMQSRTDAEKDAYRIASLKTGENYSTGQPRVDLISPINISNSHNYTQYVSVIGLNLYINTGASVVRLVRVKDENGVSITPEETLIDASSIQTFSTNFQILVLGINFFGKAKGYYKIYITSFTGLTNLTSPEFLVNDTFILSNFNPVSFEVVDKYANIRDTVNSTQIYHISDQIAGKTILEKSVKSNVLFNFQNGFLYEFNLEMYLIGTYTNASFNCGFSNGDFGITNGYSPQAFLGVGGVYGHRFINSVTDKDHNQARNQTVVVKCIFFNKNGITTMVQIAPNGTVLVSSMVENYSTGDNVRFYANFFSTDGNIGMSVGTYYKINFINTYQKF